MQNTKTVVVNTNQQVVGINRDVELKMITLDTGYIPEGKLDQPISRYDEHSITWRKLVGDLLFNYNEYYDLPEIGSDVVNIYIDKIYKDGYVFYTQGDDDEITIYEIDESLVESYELIESCTDRVEIYIPSPKDLEYGYDRYTKFHNVLDDLGSDLVDFPELIEKIFENEVYKFIHDNID